MNALAAHSLADIPVFRAAQLKAGPGGGAWRWENLVGALSEISEEAPSGALSFVTEIIAAAQGQNDPVAWVAGTQSIFFPPDLMKRGIDLSALAVIRAGADADSLTAAEWLVRSGAFGLVIIDCEGAWSVSDGLLGRIQKLAERNVCAVVFLTRKRPSEPSLGSRISLRGCITRTHAEPLAIAIDTIKDKKSNSRSRQGRKYNGPSGMY